MRIRWTTEAADNLEEIFNYCAANRPEYLRPTMLKIRDGVKSLRSMPFRGRIGREPGTRELTFSTLRYVVVYRIQHETVELISIRHTSMDPKPSSD